MPATLAEAPTTNPLRRIAFDLGAERRARSSGVAFPPGPLSFSLARTRSFARNPLPILLDCHERYGPVFSIRVLHSPVVFMLGPEAKHYVTVTNAGNFRWRDGSMGDLIPLLGDGLLTIDGPYHRRSRHLMLPSFHRERIAASAGTMVEETTRALESWSPGSLIDLYHWTRALALRIAMRALLGLDPDRGEQADLAGEFEDALAFWGRDYLLQTIRGPFSPFARMQQHRRRLDRLVYGEIARRRASAERREDLIGVLLGATDDSGEPLGDREVRDHLVTLLFAGHDTATSTTAFLFHELLRHPEALERVLEEQDRVLGGRAPTAEELVAACRSSRPRWTRRSASTRPPGWGRGARSRASASRASPFRPARWSTTAPGRATGLPRSSQSRTPSGRSASRRRRRRPFPRARTCLSGAARAPASACASGSSR